HHCIYHLLHPPNSTLFPYTTLFRSLGMKDRRAETHERRRPEHHDETSRPRQHHHAEKREPHAGRERVRLGMAVRVKADHRLQQRDRKSTRLNSSHVKISYAVFCLKK